MRRILNWKGPMVKKFIFQFIVCTVLICPLLANQGVKKIIVGTKQAPPFSFKDHSGQWTGISIALWKTLAEELGIEYVFKEYDLPGLLAAVENKSIDAAVAALTITAEREKHFDFSHPFHTSGLGIAVLQIKKNPWMEVFNRFFSREFLRVVLALALLLFGVGLLLWFLERKKNQEQFGGSAMAGLGSGFWWSAVTMTTVGYGDKAPKSFGGRLIGIVWMFVAIIIISSFTAAITSTLTLNKIQSRVRGPQDLHQANVGSLKHSSSASYLDNNQIPFQDYASVIDALNGLLKGEIDAVVYDRPILRFLVAEEKTAQLQVLGSHFERQQYGIGLPTGSPLREPINQLIPDIIHRNEWQGILFRYMGDPTP